MKTYFSLCIIILFASCAPRVYNRLNWQKNEVTADGNLKEWSNPLKYFDSGSKLNYTISNDRQNLYICIKAGDDVSQKKILHAGMEIRIDTSGKKTYPMTLSYPIPDGEKMKRKRVKDESTSEQDYISEKQQLAGGFKELKLTGFLIPASSLPAQDNSFGIKAAISVDKNDVLVYELILPFKVFYKSELAAADTNKVFNYQIEVNGISYAKDELDKAADDGSGNGGSGSGMPNGGGMGGNGMGRMGGGGGGRSGGAAAADPLAEMDLINLSARFSFKP